MNFNNIISIIFLVILSASIIIKIILDIINYNYRKKNKSLIPKDLQDYIDKKKLCKINNYNNDNLKLEIIEFLVSSSFLYFIILSGLIPYYYNLLKNIFTNVYILSFIIFGSFALLNSIINIPFSLYHNFVIEKKYDFNKMTFKLWIIDLIKSTVIGSVITVIMLTVLISFVYIFPSIWWILIYIFLILFSLIMQILYPKVIAPLFNKFTPIDDDILKQKIDKLLSDIGFKSKGIFIVDASKRSKHSNAYFTGFGKSKQIVLFDTLINTMNHDEILAVLAHELGHFKKKHIIKQLLLHSIVYLLLLYLANFFLKSELLYNAFNLKGTIPFMGLFILSIIIEPVIFFIKPIFSGLSRKYEYEADNFSVIKTGNKTALKESLIKLYIDNLSNLYPADIYVWFYYSHPPLIKRLNNEALAKI